MNLRDIGERSERAGQDSSKDHALMRSIVEGTDDAIFVKDVRGRYLMVNPSYATLVGRPVEAMLGKADEELFPPAASGTFVEGDRRILETGGASQVETSVPMDDGARTFLANKAAYRDARGEVAGIIGILTDITERKRIEEALRESEGRYRAVIEQAAEGIHISDAESRRILDSNAAFRGLLGYTLEELQQMTLYDFVAHDRESIDAHAREILKKGSHYIGERQYRRKDGSLVDVEVNTSLISYGGRRVVCALSHDITRSKRTEERLQRSLKSLLALYEAGQILNSTLEFEDIGTSLLQIMRRITGFTTAVISVPDEDGRLRVWRATGFENLWRKARYSPEVQEALDAARNTGERQRFELRSSDDREGLLVLCLPLLVRDRTIGLLEVYGPVGPVEGETEEILESLAAQAASALENGRLYGELGERERQLRVLVGRLFTAQEEERRLVAYDVHDGVTQVAVAAYHHLQAFAGDHPDLPEQGRRQLDLCLELAQQTANEARRVIAGLRPMALDDFGLAPGIRSQLDDLEKEGWNVTYRETLGGERLPVQMETALFRVAQEALTNVRKHARTDRVEVGLWRLDGSIALEVRDRGQGFRATDVAYGGPGEKVGLSSMKERVALLGGDFRLESAPNAGTTIRVHVPLPQNEKADRGG